MASALPSRPQSSTPRPKFSILLPIYNGDRYVRSALETVQAQTLADWELIVVDDGSTDDTPAILQQAPADHRRQVIHQANRGLAAARNRALAAAHGEYLAFLDVDDIWRLTYLAEMAAALDGAAQAVAALCGWQYVDDAGRWLPQSVLLSPLEVNQLEETLSWRNSILPSAMVVPLAALRQAGDFDESLRAVEDWDMWLRLKPLGPFVAVPRVLTGYRVHDASMTEDVAAIEAERLKVNAKHLGPLDGSPSAWPPARRQAVGFTYFNAALGYLRQNKGDQGRARVRQALACWPMLSQQDEFYYELGCAFQPRGWRGTATGLDLDAGAALIHDILSSALPDNQASASALWGHACLVLARLALNTGNRRGCRAYALRALTQASMPERLSALRLLARSAVPAAWARALRRKSPAALASQPG